jgi:putative DNA primase/helicase
MSVIWPEPLPIDEGLPPVPAFSDKLMPGALRPWLGDIAERMQCAPDFVAVGAVVGLGAVVGRAVGVKPRRRDDWLVVPNVWGAVVARSGLLKTPAFEGALAPVKRLAAQEQARYEGAIRDYEFQLQVSDARKAEARKKLAKATPEELPGLRAELEAEVAAPSARRFIVNDATIEKLALILKDNPRGVLHFRDELTGWLSSMNRDGHEGDRAFFLESWSGLSPYSVDRIARGTQHIPALCISVLGGIQPDPLGIHLRSMLRGGQAADGLLQRFQVTVWPDVASWRNVDRWPDTAARTRAFEVYERLASLAVEPEPGATDPIPALHFDQAAQELFDSWLGELETRLRAGGEHQAFESHLAKYKKLMPALALLGHLADAGEGPIALDQAERAAAWCEFLEAHARRLYASVMRADDIAARALLEKLRRGEAKAPLVAREIYRRCWSGLSALEDVEGALGVLETHGYVRRVEVATGGRPRVEYAVHPSLAKGAA